MKTGGHQAGDQHRTDGRTGALPPGDTLSRGLEVYSIAQLWEGSPTGGHREGHTGVNPSSTLTCCSFDPQDNLRAGGVCPAP